MMVKVILKLLKFENNAIVEDFLGRFCTEVDIQSCDFSIT